MYFNLQLVQRTRKYHIRRRLSWNRVHNSCSIVVFVNSPLQQQTNKPILSFCSYIPELVAIEWTQFTAPQLRSFCIFTWRFCAITSITSVSAFRETVFTIVVALRFSWTVHFCSAHKHNIKLYKNPISESFNLVVTIRNCDESLLYLYLVVPRKCKYHNRRSLSWNRVHNTCSNVVFVNSPLL